MRKLALTLTAALVVGGCTSETGGVQDAVRVAAKSPALTPSTLSAEARRITAFASMPDRGSLLAFERLQQPVRRKAHTYHAVQLSEAHALKAAHPGGMIELPTPSGETLRIAYQRHEESLDGNWTWIGRTLDGMDAVITFGEKAVFGRIAQPNTEALRLTMSGGRAWLVETDPSKLLDGNLLGDEDATGMLVPPKTVQATLTGKRAKSVSTAGGEKASAAETVDVVLGYTNGLVTRYGNVSAATTRLTYLTALTNQAYQNSQVTGRIRLVHTLQVNYTDTNSNETALQALTGQTCNPTCSPTTVPAELVPLRTARDQYGGDLVSLVRPFQAPQHQGCGIAWLLGGGGFTIDNTDAPFGYSVVSDGNDDDETDGRNYFCREETLAHELGHNMGQQHNTEDSGGDSGTHPYSYGYREASSTGFYTIMAYRLSNSSQFAIPHFGNPSVNYSGRPTGTANADNARSLNLSIPLVAQFRAVVVPIGGKVRNDFNGDGRSEIYWRENSTGESYIWTLNGTAVTAAASVHREADLGWRVVGTGDFNADGRTDVFWRHNTTGATYIHLMNGMAKLPGSGGSQTVPDQTWQIVMFGDFDGNGSSDVYWRNTTTGQCLVWYMQGLLPSRTAIVYTAPAEWKTIGAGDFNGDGVSDVLWHNSTTGEVYVHRMSSTGINPTGTGSLGRVADLNWEIVATGDFNGDSKSDLFWRNKVSGGNIVWTIDGTSVSSIAQSSVVPDTSWKVVSSGDYNGDGREDIFWRHSGNGSNYIHLLNGATLLAGSGGTSGVPNTNWQVAGGATSH